MAPQTQRALVVPAERAPWELRTDWRVPAPGPKEVLVKLMAASLSPCDWSIQTFGSPFITDYPYVGGVDGAGVVEAVGTEVTNFARGDRV